MGCPEKDSAKPGDTIEITYGRDVIKVEWEYWPAIVGRTQDDPICVTANVEGMKSAIHFVGMLKKDHGQNLRIVTFTTVAYLDSWKEN